MIIFREGSAVILSESKNRIVRIWYFSDFVSLIFPDLSKEWELICIKRFGLSEFWNLNGLYSTVTASLLVN